MGNDKPLVEPVFDGDDGDGDGRHSNSGAAQPEEHSQDLDLDLEAELDLLDRELETLEMQTLSLPSSHKKPAVVKPSDEGGVPVQQDIDDLQNIFSDLTGELEVHANTNSTLTPTGMYRSLGPPVDQYLAAKRENDQKLGAGSMGDAVKSSVAKDSEKSDQSLVISAKQAFDSQCYERALAILEQAAQTAPLDHIGLNLVQRATEKLVSQYIQILGGMDAVPVLGGRQEDFADLQIDHRSGFVLSQVDGQVSVEDILNLSGMPTVDTLKILVRLVLEGVIRAVVR